MLKGSFWYPTSVPRILLLLVVVASIPLHQSEFLGLMSSTTLVFGWLPMQMAYDILFLLGGVVVLYIMYMTAPDAPEQMEPTEKPTAEGTNGGPNVDDTTEGDH